MGFLADPLLHNRPPAEKPPPRPVLNDEPLFSSRRRPPHRSLSLPMETRSSPSMGELRTVAAERGLKYYRHLSKPELFSLLQRKEGGGGGAKAGAKVETDKPSGDSGKATATRASERLSRKTKRKAGDATQPVKKKKIRVVTNSQDPIMLTPLGPHTVPCAVWSQQGGVGRLRVVVTV